MGRIEYKEIVPCPKQNPPIVRRANTHLLSQHSQVVSAKTWIQTPPTAYSTATGGLGNASAPHPG